MDLDQYFAEKQHEKKYAAYRWQDEAVNYAQKLGFKPNKGWFKFFKTYFDKYEPKFLSIMEKAINPNIKNKEKYFYWMFYNENKNQSSNSWRGWVGR